MKNNSISLRRLTRVSPSSRRNFRTVAAPRALGLSLLALAAFTTMPIRAQESAADADGQSQVKPSANYGLEGVWDVTVTIRDAAGNPLRSFRAMNLFICGGQFEEFGVGTPPGQRGPGMGVWQREGRTRYRAVLEFFRFDLSGNFIGTQKVTRTIELSAAEDGFTSTSEIQILNASGQLIQSGDATERATRFK